ncbi:serine hydrolase domain-containing protein [Paenibacillus septentrionalis]|uniref:Serine hydrolase domain-containing protein n=1 Tax=Paenibacillus septentrionalis TaxID=429342 RepID=A0ABW1V382_9BACL
MQWIDEIIKKHNQEEQGRIQFSGAILISTKGEINYENSCGFSNRSDKIKNTTNTRFGIASGCKIFTAIAICQLVEKGLLDFNTSLGDIGIDLGQLDSAITVHHLLAHTSGIADYFDEEFMTDYEGLWKTMPMYTMTSPKCFLPMFKHSPSKFAPGTQFSYNNAGFIVLGLIVEKLSGLSFNHYVQEHIFLPCGMHDSGYFSMDQLPERTAIGYVGNDGNWKTNIYAIPIVGGPDGNWKTNIYAIPIVGGPDGGAYTTVHDLDKFWNALMENRLLSKELTEKMLYPHARESEYIHYGYGVWMIIDHNKVFKFFVMGSDPGVVMQSSYYPASKTQAHVIANANSGASFIASQIDANLFE